MATVDVRTSAAEDAGVSTPSATPKRRVFRIKTNIKLPTLTHLHHKPLVNLEFEDIRYTVQDSGKGRKTILKSVSGRFKSGELVAIMGTSGAGKSTLLNILSGYKCANVTGRIKINGKPRQLRTFHKLSCYIMQEDLLQPLLTVEESMFIAANLKLGSSISQEDKNKVVDEVLNTLGLVTCRHTRMEKLSGGQKKRFSIALELVNNPPIIFLDEPTTGLDMSTAKQCLSFLKMLAEQGRTIICSIHTPSANQFAMFDNVYVLSKGVCVYHGGSDQVVPFLSSVGIPCPKHYNPADFVLEVTQPECVENIETMSSAIRNGKSFQKMNSAGELIREEFQFSEKGESGKHESSLESTALEADMNYHCDYPNNGLVQFYILLKRMMIQSSRNLVAIGLQTACAIITAATMGVLFYNIGNQAELARSNLNFCLCCLVFFFYNQLMALILLFPNTVKLLKREYFNRWYGLKAFYMAASLSKIPLNVVINILFITTCYMITNQPLEYHRFFLFLTSLLIFDFVSESFALAIASSCSPTTGAVIGPTIAFPILAISIIGLGQTSGFSMMTEFVMSLSIFRYGFVALVLCLYDGGRPELDCSSMYCHFKEPDSLIKFVGMSGCSLWVQLVGLLGYLLLFRFISYISLRWRVTPEFSNPVLNYLLLKLRKR